MNYKDYTIVIRPDGVDAYVAHIPAIPGCHALGKTPLEAQNELQNVFEMIRDEHLDEGKDLPPDCNVTVAHAS